MPKLDEDDFVDPGNLPPIAGPKNPPPAGLASPSGMGGGMSMGGGFGSGTTNIGQQFNAAPQMDRNAGGANAAQGADVLVKHSKESEDWINKKWRPVMGWVYMATCTADFVLFPVLWSALQALSHGSVNTQWNPITLQGAGLYHIAMGAVLGIAAYGRTKEKLESKQ
jgi:hypothetical protein